MRARESGKTGAVSTGFRPAGFRPADREVASARLAFSRARPRLHGTVGGMGVAHTCIDRGII
jgi:hypothetical protein